MYSRKPQGLSNGAKRSDAATPCYKFDGRLNLKHPIQPIALDEHGVARFKENKIVTFLLDNGKHDMNSLACEDFSQEDREQFAQLIGYSLHGFGELGYVSDETYEAAAKLAENL